MNKIISNTFLFLLVFNSFSCAFASDLDEVVSYGKNRKAVSTSDFMPNGLPPLPSPPSISFSNNSSSISENYIKLETINSINSCVNVIVSINKVKYDITIGDYIDEYLFIGLEGSNVIFKDKKGKKVILNKSNKLTVKG
jgi:hypothetical protein